MHCHPFKEFLKIIWQSGIKPLDIIDKGDSAEGGTESDDGNQVYQGY